MYWIYLSSKFLYFLFLFYYKINIFVFLYRLYYNELSKKIYINYKKTQEVFMALIQLNFNSKCLGMRTNINVIIPESEEIFTM